MHEVGHETVKYALQKLEMHKVCACWVECELVLEIREQQVVAVQTFLARYEKDETKLLQWVVTGGESWIHYWTPKMQASSSVWKMKDKLSLRKFKMEHSAGKVMFTAIWDRHQGLIYTTFGTNASKRRMTITKEMNFDTLLHMRNAINEWRYKQLLQTVFLLYNNASPHCTKLIKNLITNLREEFTQPPYLPNQALSDYHLFQWLRKELGGMFQHAGRTHSKGKFVNQKFGGVILSCGDWETSHLEPEVPELKRWLRRKILWNVTYLMEFLWQFLVVFSFRKKKMCRYL